VVVVAPAATLVTVAPGLLVMLPQEHLLQHLLAKVAVAVEVVIELDRFTQPEVAEVVLVY
jgi:hypothetical protein